MRRECTTLAMLTSNQYIKLCRDSMPRSKKVGVLKIWMSSYWGNTFLPCYLVKSSQMYQRPSIIEVWVWLSYQHWQSCRPCLRASSWWNGCVMWRSQQERQKECTKHLWKQGFKQCLELVSAWTRRSTATGPQQSEWGRLFLGRGTRWLVKGPRH